VREIRFHREIYAGTAVDAAAKKLAGFAEIDLVEDPTHWVVRLRCKTESRERQVAGVLANWALGLTIDEGSR
jgi:hypothetical protein